MAMNYNYSRYWQYKIRRCHVGASNLTREGGGLEGDIGSCEGTCRHREGGGLEGIRKSNINKVFNIPLLFLIAQCRVFFI